MGAPLPKTRDFRRNERGFTLQELMTVVAIVGILIAIAVIAFLGLLERWRVEAAADQFAADLRLAHGRGAQPLLQAAKARGNRGPRRHPGGERVIW
ncbi:MAG: Tfp pilus assembly protein FimT/FimU [Rubrobacteraceae bacterium]